MFVDYEKMYTAVKSKLLSMADNPSDLYTKDEELIADIGVSGTDYTVRLRVQVSREKNLLTIYSLLPFTVTCLENKTSDFARKLMQFNYDNFYLGCYDFNPETGKIVFRVSLPFGDDTLREEQISYSIQFVYDSVNSTNGKIHDMVDGSNSVTVSEAACDLIMDRINNLTGWQEFKKLCLEISDVAPILGQCALSETFLFQNFLFSVNDGCGLTTALDCLSSLFDAAGFFARASQDPVREIKLTEDKDAGNAATPAEVIASLTAEEFESCLVCFDISEYLERSKHLLIKEFIRKLVPFENKYMFAFRVPYLEPGALEEIEEVLKDVLFIRSVPVLPFDSEQLCDCAIRILNTKGYTASDDIREIFDARVCEEKSDGRFYGIRSVEKIVHEMLWKKCCAEAAKKAEYLSSADADAPAYEVSREITRDDILDISSAYNKTKKSGFDELNELIGMEEITARIKEIVTQVKTAMAKEGMDKPCLHMRFLGAPGTGKTTVARIIGQIFRENGILRNGYFFEYTARDLVGAYVGQTAPKTAAICRDAYGSVLFIDEAYALYTDDGDKKDYGREALTTLISEMENHRDDMVVIMAGYTDDMNELMKGNAGLRSRMPFIIEFKSYTREQLYEIFMTFTLKHFTCTDDFRTVAHDYFEALSDDYISSKEFANARFARNLYERVWSKAALRSSMSGKDIVLTVEDFNNASSEEEFSEKLTTRHKLGF